MTLLQNRLSFFVLKNILKQFHKFSELIVNCCGMDNNDELCRITYSISAASAVNVLFRYRVFLCLGSRSYWRPSVVFCWDSQLSVLSTLLPTLCRRSGSQQPPHCCHTAQPDCTQVCHHQLTGTYIHLHTPPTISLSRQVFLRELYWIQFNT